MDVLSFPRALQLFEFWEQCPPVHDLVAAFVGYRSDKSPTGRRSVSHETTNPEDLKIIGMTTPGVQAIHADNLPIWMQANIELAMNEARAQVTDSK